MEKGLANTIVVFAWDSVNKVPKTGDAENITATIKPWTRSGGWGSAAAVTDTNPTELDDTNNPGQYAFDLTNTESNIDAAIITPVSETSGVVLNPVMVFFRPTNFSKLSIHASDPAGGVLLQYVQSGVVIPTVTSVTNLPDVKGPILASGLIGNSGNDTTHLNLDSLSYADDEIKNQLILFYDVSTELQHIRYITSWVNSTKLATLDRALPAAPEDSVDSFWVLTFQKDADLIDAPNPTAVSAIQSGLATQSDLTNGTVVLHSAYDPAMTAAQAGDQMNLVDGAITANKYDQSTAFPIEAADSGATQIARAGDEMDLVDTPNATAVTAIQNGLATSSALSTLAGIFTGITSLAQWLGLIAGKQTGNSTARTELRATGAGSGSYDETTDSLEAIRDKLADADLTATRAESYGGDGENKSVVQQLCEIEAHLGRSANSGTTKTIYQRDNSTAAKTYTYDDADTPTSITETT